MLINTNINIVIYYFWNLESEICFDGKSGVNLKGILWGEEGNKNYWIFSEGVAKWNFHCGE